MYQSEYAKEYLSNIGIRPEAKVRLSDYLNKVYLDREKRFSQKGTRKRRVLYNPKKGYEFTKKIIDAAHDIDWVPIEGFSNEDLVSLFQTSMAYIDFGNHPGKDRLPRETAVCGCCVIVGSVGAAAFRADMPLPDWAIFNREEGEIPRIVDTLRDLLDNYEVRCKEYEEYVDLIFSEKERFEQDLDAVVRKIESQ